MIALADVEASDGPPRNLGIDTAADEDPPKIRAILCKVGEKPRVIELAADHDAKALEELLGAPVARLAMRDGVQLHCDRDGLIFGLALARRALEMSLAEPALRELTLRFDGSETHLSPDEWPVSGDFLLARAGEGGELVDLTEADLKHWMFWLGLDHIMNRLA